MIRQYRQWLRPDELREIRNTINQPRWKFGHASTVGSSDGCQFWQLNVDPSEEFYYNYLFNRIKETTGENFEIERVYFNGHQHSSHGNSHQDSNDENARTFLIYCNEIWYPEMGGHTNFIKPTDPIEVVSVPPYPYSASYFDGHINHFASPISPTFRGLRVTLAFKLHKV